MTKERSDQNPSEKAFILYPFELIRRKKKLNFVLFIRLSEQRNQIIELNKFKHLIHICLSVPLECCQKDPIEKFLLFHKISLENV